MKRIRRLAHVVLMLAPLCPPHAAEPPAAAFRVAREGEPEATIVVAKRAPAAADFAAAELQEHVRIITGATLPIATDESEVKGRRILVGESAATRALKLRPSFKLADDPGLDGNQLIEEFFTRYYGSAAAPMKALYCAIEDTYSNPASYPGVPVTP